MDDFTQQRTADAMMLIHGQLGELTKVIGELVAEIRAADSRPMLDPPLVRRIQQP